MADVSGQTGLPSEWSAILFYTIIRPSIDSADEHDGSPLIAYAVCFLIEIAGMALILWDGVPLFQHLIRFERTVTAFDINIMSIAVILIQVTYWASLRHDPPFDLPRQQFIGHVFLLLSRLIFIFAAGVFSLVVYRYPEMFEFSLSKMSLLIAVLFSVFCFSRHLERIGNLLNTGHKAPLPR